MATTSMSSTLPVKKSQKKGGRNMKPTQRVQGDVFLNPVSKNVDLSVFKQIAPDSGRVILALGEATGHHHSVDAMCATLFENGDLRVLVVGEPTTVEHQEHGAIELAPGQYWVVPQREYTPQEIVRVRD